MPRKTLTEKKIKEIHDSAIAASSSDEAWKILRPLIRAQESQEEAADALIDVVSSGYLSLEQATNLLSEIYVAHKDNDHVMILLGSAMEAARDIDYLNAPPPETPLFSNVVKRLSEISLAAKGSEREAAVIEALSCTTRLMARQYDNLAEKSYARLVELLPETPWAHYNQGLFFKTRGHFAEGLLANQKAIALLDTQKESYQWNLGICATGAGEGEIALNVWKEMGQKIEMGRFDLPEGLYPICKVRLAERPLAQRDASHDDPGLEETIWIERLSPCHGIIRSVLYQDLGIDYGDVVLIDGAPITYHKYGDERIPVFPHLATLRKNNYQFYDFAGTQETKGKLGDVSTYLERDAIVYSHTENYIILCSACWRDVTIDHEHKDTEEKHVVTGRIAAPPDIEPVNLLKQIDGALKDAPENRIFSPDLCRAAGFEDRAQIEERRYKLLHNTVH
jgi:hypothetical protein